MKNRLAPRTTLLVALALALHWLMAVSVSPRMGLTYDEPPHLAAGYSYWERNDYRLNPENGMLPVRWANLPLLAMGLKFPSVDSPGWLRSDAMAVGDAFLLELDNPTGAMLGRARAMIALVSAFTVWLVWRWARGLYGSTAGWLALLLAGFCPALLAHAGLVTSDLAVTACILAALSSVWLLLHRVTWIRFALAVLACTAALLAKTSGLIIVPLAGAMLLVRWLRAAPLVVALGRGPVRWLRRSRQVIAATLALIGAAGAVILVLLWGAYGFRYSGFNPDLPAPHGYLLSWDVVLERAPLPEPYAAPLTQFIPARAAPAPTLLTRIVSACRDARLLPEAYLWGLAHTLKFSRERPAYFFGEISKTGWRTFFPTVFVMKTTLPALALFAAGVAALLPRKAARTSPLAAPQRARQWRLGRLYRAAPLLIFFLGYWALSINSTLNIGHRHILPTYPVFYVIASGAVLWLGGRIRRLAAWSVMGAVALHAADSLAARPFYLSYFQPMFGGAERGRRYFSDSSIDWGQGLPDLSRWDQDRRRNGDAAPLFLSYAGVDSLRRWQINATRFGDALFDNRERIYPAHLRGGWFAISVTQFHRLYLPVRGPWTDRHEQLYQELLSRLRDAEARMRSGRAADERVRRDAADYELMQLGRLIHFLGDREPDEIVAASLLMFRLTDAEVARALYGPLPPVPRARPPR